MDLIKRRLLEKEKEANMYTKLTLQSIHYHKDDYFDMSCYANNMHSLLKIRIQEMLEKYPIKDKNSRFYRFSDYLEALYKNKLTNSGLLFLFEDMCRIFYTPM